MLPWSCQHWHTPCLPAALCQATSLIPRKQSMLESPRPLSQSCQRACTRVAAHNPTTQCLSKQHVWVAWGANWPQPPHLHEPPHSAVGAVRADEQVIGDEPAARTVGPPEARFPPVKIYVLHRSWPQPPRTAGTLQHPWRMAHVFTQCLGPGGWELLQCNFSSVIKPHHLQADSRGMRWRGCRRCAWATSCTLRMRKRIHMLRVQGFHAGCSARLQAALEVERDGGRVQAPPLGDQLRAQRAAVHDVRAAGAVREQAAGGHVDQAGAARGAGRLAAARRVCAGRLQCLQRPEPSRPSPPGRRTGREVRGATYALHIAGAGSSAAGQRLRRPAHAVPWVQHTWLTMVQQGNHDMPRAHRRSVFTAAVTGLFVDQD